MQFEDIISEIQHHSKKDTVQTKSKVTWPASKVHNHKKDTFHNLKHYSNSITKSCCNIVAKWTKLCKKKWYGPLCIFMWHDCSAIVFSWFYGLTSSGKYSSSCPSSMVYSYNITSSSRTCRCIGTTDLSCHLSFPPIDGCICAEGTYLEDSGKCVPPEACPCYDKGSVVLSGQTINKEGVMWYEKWYIARDCKFLLCYYMWCA